MFHFSTNGLRQRIWDDKAHQPQTKKGWHYYAVKRDGSLHYKGPFPNKFSEPGLLVQYWVGPWESDWQDILSGLLTACEKSGRISLHG